MVFGAIIARKFGEHFSKHQIQYNYPLMGAAGYSGLMVWHGGLSGSAPLKVAEEGHFLADTMGVMPISETIFSNMNLVTTAVMLIVLPSFAYWLAKRSQTKQVPLSFFQQQTSNHKVAEDKPVQWQFIAVTFGAMILLLALSSIFSDTQAFYKKITTNFINLLLFGLCILFHGNYNRFLAAVDEAISSTSGIMIQFPLYGGIMGIMKFSGLMAMISEAFTTMSSDVTFPLFTFISAAIVNVFVPSGGGQWAVQGPIIVEAASNLNVSISKSVMALAYGDQLTNMIQPFWALPLLGITALKPQQLIPYTALFMLVGMVIFMGALLVF